MREGYKTILEFLENDVRLEQEEEVLLKRLAARSSNPKVKAKLGLLVRAARGHADGLREIIREIEQDEHQVAFYCPICGWVVDFGKNPSVGNEARCAICCQKFALVEKGGDYSLAKVTA
jgi:rubrerythrin